VRRIAAQENTPVAKPVGNHTSPCPVLFPENLELESGVHTKDLPDAMTAVEKR
jgi:hypothetical protein